MSALLTLCRRQRTVSRLLSNTIVPRYPVQASSVLSSHRPFSSQIPPSVTNRLPGDVKPPTKPSSSPARNFSQLFVGVASVTALGAAFYFAWENIAPKQSSLPQNPIKIEKEAPNVPSTADKVDKNGDSISDAEEETVRAAVDPTPVDSTAGESDNIEVSSPVVGEEQAVEVSQGSDPSPDQDSAASAEADTVPEFSGVAEEEPVQLSDLKEESEPIAETDVEIDISHGSEAEIEQEFEPEQDTVQEVSPEAEVDEAPAEITKADDISEEADVIAAMAADIEEDAEEVLKEVQEASEIAAPDEAKASYLPATLSVEIPPVDELTPGTLTAISHDQTVQEASERGDVSLAVEAAAATERKEGVDAAAELLHASIHLAVQRQAEMDARVMQEAITAITEEHRSELENAYQQVASWKKVVADVADELDVIKASFEVSLDSQKKAAEERRMRDLQEKSAEAEAELKEALLLADAKLAAAVAEAEGRGLKNLDELHFQFKALREAFYHKSEESRKSHLAHKIALCALSLDEAVNGGLPLSREVFALRLSAGGADLDPLLDLVLQSLPEETIQKGVLTRVQLQAHLQSIESELRTLALLPAGGGGILAHALAKVVSLLKVPERGTPLNGGGVEATIARTHLLLSEGRLAEAAQVIQFGLLGTGAESLALSWAREATNRAMVEQSLAIIHSHATILSASLS